MTDIVDESMVHMQNIEIKYEEDDPNQNIQGQNKLCSSPDDSKDLENIQQKNSSEGLNEDIKKIHPKENKKQKTVDTEDEDESDESSDSDSRSDEYDSSEEEISMKKQDLKSQKNPIKKNASQKKKALDTDEESLSNSSSGLSDQRQKSNKGNKGTRQGTQVKRGGGRKCNNQNQSENKSKQKRRQTKKTSNILDDIEFNNKEDNQLLQDTIEFVNDKQKKKRNNQKTNLKDNQLVERVLKKQKTGDLEEQTPINSELNNKQNNLIQFNNFPNLIDRNKTASNDLKFQQINPLLQFQNLASQLQVQQLQIQQLQAQHPFIQQNGNINTVQPINNPLLFQNFQNQLLFAKRQLMMGVKQEDNAQSFVPQVLPQIPQQVVAQNTVSSKVIEEKPQTTQETNVTNNRTQKRAGRKAKGQIQNQEKTNEKSKKDDESFQVEYLTGRKKKYNTRNKVINYAESPLRDDMDEEEEQKLKQKEKEKQQKLKAQTEITKQQNIVNQQKIGKETEGKFKDSHNQKDQTEYNENEGLAKKNQTLYRDEYQDENKQDRMKRKQNTNDNMNQSNQTQQNMLKLLNYDNLEQRRDVCQIQGSNVLQGNMLCNKKNQSQDIIEEQNQKRQLQIKLPKQGHFMYEDKPKTAGQTKLINDDIMIEVIWEKRSNGEIPDPTILSSEVIKTYDKDFLIEFYESKVKKTNARAQLIQQQQQQQRQKSLDQMINNSNKDTLRSEFYKSKQLRAAEKENIFSEKPNKVYQILEKQTMTKTQELKSQQNNQIKQNNQIQINDSSSDDSFSSIKKIQNKGNINVNSLNSHQSTQQNNKSNQLKEKEGITIASSSQNSQGSEQFCIEDPYRKFIEDEGLLSEQLQKEMQVYVKF